MMRLQKIKLHHVQIPLRLSIKQTDRAARRSDNIIVCVVSGKGTIGYGESCPQREATGETSEQVVREIKSLQGELLETTFSDLDSIRDWSFAKLEQGIGPAAVCALELALLDVWCQENGQDLVTALGGVHRGSWTYSGVLPFDDISNLLPLLAQFRFTVLKLNAEGTDHLLDNIHSLRQVYGPSLQLKIDAKGGWTPERAAQIIPSLYEKGVTTFEQPLAPGSEEAMAMLTHHYGDRVVIMADESATTYESVERLIESKAVNHINLKISKHGGLFATMRIHELARRHGISCQLGAHYGETSILGSAAMVYASIADDLSCLEGGLGMHLLENDICSRPLKLDGMASIRRPDSLGIGWGVPIDNLLLIRYALRNYLWEAAKFPTLVGFGN